jgi:hypothetical protein
MNFAQVPGDAFVAFMKRTMILMFQSHINMSIYERTR